MPHSKKGVRFHVLSKDYCPYCKYAKGAMMMYFKTDTLEKLSKHVTFYEDNDEQFYETVGDVVPDSYHWIPQIVEESEDGKMKFIGGVSQFVKKYS